MTTAVRVRFAPSPTGTLHIGNARTALFNWLYARSLGGKFILRIEDTDQVRSTPEATQAVLDSMRWLGIDWDEGPECGGPHAPYFQAQRLDLYRAQLENLAGQGLAYRCFCTDAELQERRKAVEDAGGTFLYDGRCRSLGEAEIKSKLGAGAAFSWRFRTEAKTLAWDDLVRGPISFDGALLGDFIIVRSDGFPTYNFAVVVDDGLMGITHVLRGEDHVSNTPRQLFLYQALGLPVPRFGHLSMILGENREKLSKRHGATGVMEFRENGYLPDALINHLALLGWAPEDGIEVIPREKLKKAFVSPHFHAAPAVFDYAKLDFLNGTAIRGLTPESAWEAFQPFLAKLDFIPAQIRSDRPRMEAMVELVRSHCHRLSDLGRELRVLFVDELTPPEEVRKEWLLTDGARALAKLASERLSALDAPTVAYGEIQQLQKDAKTLLNLGGKHFFKPLRVMLLGAEHGLELEKVLPFLTRAQVLRRLGRNLN
ncbi:MAG: glutamate--tRNA ligase [Spirochaetes bacterium]|nr:glutamate--tRNA ligase [Spirochaetota bacterium]